VVNLSGLHQMMYVVFILILYQFEIWKSVFDIYTHSSTTVQIIVIYTIYT